MLTTKRISSSPKTIFGKNFKQIREIIKKRVGLKKIEYERMRERDNSLKRRKNIKKRIGSDNQRMKLRQNS